jgi:hypothetical protein
MQIFMYVVMEEHLQMDKGKSLVSQYEEDHDAQKIYRDLKKHALGSTAAQLSSDTLLKYITTARYPDNWRGTSFAFVLHWQEQVRRYERLELEEFQPRRKLRMIQNAVGDVTELEAVKKLADLGVANGNRPLTYESYVALLLEACYTFDKKRELPGRQKRAVYAAAITDNDMKHIGLTLIFQRLWHMHPNLIDLEINRELGNQHPSAFPTQNGSR